MIKYDRLHITINSILYILNRLGGKSDFLKVFKILYFAEMEHLRKYGRMFSENNYKSLPNGPVPDYAYSAMKCLRGDSDSSMFSDKDLFAKSFRVHDNHFITSLLPEDLEELSISEIKCLDFSIEENKHLSFNDLSDKSHGPAWQSAQADRSVISLEQIAKEANLNPQMIRYSLEQESFKRNNILN